MLSRLEDREPLKDSSSFAGVSISQGTMGSFPLLWPIRYGTRSLSRTSFQDCDSFQSEPATGYSHATSVRPAPATLSSVLLIPLAFSPSPDINGGTDLLAIGSPDCLPL